MNRFLARWPLLLGLLTFSHQPAFSQNTDDAPVSAKQAATRLKKGDRIEVLWSTTWYAATVLETRGAETKIHYDGYGDNWDEWVGPDRVRPRGAASANAASGSKPSDRPKVAYKKPGGPLPGARSLDSGIYFLIRSYFFNGRVSISQEHYVFWNDGRLYAGVPVGGLENFNFAKAWQNEPQLTGTYTISGGKITFKFANGQTPSASFAREAGGFKMDGLFVSRQGKYKPNQRLNGTFSGGASAGGGTSTYVANARSLRLTNGGAFESSSIGAISAATSNGTVNAGSSNSSKGTYTLGGNTLTLKHQNGKTTRHTVYPYNLGEGRIGINLDGTLLHPPRK